MPDLLKFYPLLVLISDAIGVPGEESKKLRKNHGLLGPCDETLFQSDNILGSSVSLLTY